MDELTTIISSGEIVLYQPDNMTNLEVRIDVEHNTVWLAQAQMSQLFGRDISVISRHIRKIFEEGELDRESNLQKMQFPNSDKPIEFYDLDVIISVGYRVHSPQGIAFRRWATSILKDYLLRGSTISRQLVAIQERTDERFLKVEKQLNEHQQQIEFFIRTNQPPIEGIFFEGQIFDAYCFVEGLVQQAKKSIVLVDNYIDASVIDTLGQGQGGVDVAIYTEHVTAAISHAAELYNAQHPDHEVRVKASASRFHDRFLIIDDDVYHLGASVKDLGRRLFAFTRLGLDKSLILQQV